MGNLNVTNSAPNNSMARKILIALMGPTKSGKTTLIGLLTDIFFRFMAISSSMAARTKIIADYHFDLNFDGEIEIEEIDTDWSKIFGGYNSKIEDYNNNLNNNPILANVFGFEEINDENEENLQNYIKSKIKSFTNRVLTDAELQKLLTTEGIDNYIKRIVFKVKPCEKLKDYILKNNINLTVRDTRGLLDEDINRIRKPEGLTNSKSYKDLGLDKLDGVVFICNDNYPEIMNDLYKETIECTLKALPVFFVTRTDIFDTLFFNIKGYVVTDENVENFLAQDINSDTNDGCKKAIDKVRTKFDITYKFLEQYDITILNQQTNEWELKDKYFNKQCVEYFLPQSEYLIKAATNNIQGDANEYELLKLSARFNIITIIDHIYKLKHDMYSLFNEGKQKSELVRSLYDSSYKANQNILADIKKYNGGPRDTNYTRPVLRYTSYRDLDNDILDNNTMLIGPQNGITTRSNGHLKYRAAAVSAVTSYNWIQQVISDLPEFDFEVHGKTKEQVNELILKTLRYTIYNGFTDFRATINGWSLIDRDLVAQLITEVRKKKCNDPLYRTVENVLDKIIKCLQDTNDITQCNSKDCQVLENQSN